MLLQVIHTTRYAYAAPVRGAEHLAHLRPQADAGQKVLEHALQITPAPSRIRRSHDVYGNERAFFSLHVEHTSLEVTARSVVHTVPRAACTGGMAWEEVRERLAYRREAPYAPAAEFAFASPCVPRDEAFIEFARPSFTASRPLQDACDHLMRRIHDAFRYEPHVTDATTPALEALRLRRGVCQDYAHVMLGCLRSLGLAARYVSGYLLTHPPPGQPRLVGADASHAWVEVHVPDPAQGAQWMGFDPTNARTPGEDCVVLARGRDFADVSPLRGVLQGGAHHLMHVAVTVTPIESRPAHGKESP
jgi:transglutaminase-like putative cysteine protease